MIIYYPVIILLYVCIEIRTKQRAQITVQNGKASLCIN